MATVLGIIGSGNIGAGVARMASAAGLEVIISNSRGPESLANLVAEIGGPLAAGTVAGAVEGADVVVLALPIAAHASLPVAALAGKTVVDAMNYVPQIMGRIAEFDATPLTSSEYLQSLWPDVRLVKALNNVDFLRFPLLPRVAGAADRSALPIAGDDVDARTQVAALLDALGFDALDLGVLAEGRRFQPGSPLYVAPYSMPREPISEDRWQAFVEALPNPVPLSTARSLAATD